MTRYGMIVAAAFAFCAITGHGRAETVTVRDNPANGSSVFESGLGRTIAIRSNGLHRSVGAGVFGLQFGTADGWTSFVSFCLDLNEWLVLPNRYQRVDDDVYFGDEADRAAMGVLFGNLINAEFGLKDATSAAALQAVIWEIREDGATEFNLEEGAFSVVTRDVLLRGQSLWGMIASGGFAPVPFDIFAAPGTQDLLVSDVPLPAGFVLFGTALAAAGALRRRAAR